MLNFVNVKLLSLLCYAYSTNLNSHSQNHFEVSEEHILVSFYFFFIVLDVEQCHVRGTIIEVRVHKTDCMDFFCCKPHALLYSAYCVQLIA